MPGSVKRKSDSGCEILFSLRQTLHSKQDALRRLGRHNPKVKDFRRKQKKVDNNPAIHSHVPLFAPSKETSRCVIGAV